MLTSYEILFRFVLFNIIHPYHRYVYRCGKIAVALFTLQESVITFELQLRALADNKSVSLVENDGSRSHWREINRSS